MEHEPGSLLPSLTAICGDGPLRRYARRAACLGAAFHALSYYEEDTGHKAEVTLSWENDSCTVTIIDHSGCINDTVRALERALPRLLGSKPMVEAFHCRERGGEAKRYHGIVSALIEGFRGEVLDCMRRTAMASREYFYVVGWNGEYAEGLGEEYSVTLPSIPGVVFAHTHPGLCYPSSKDLASFADFFASGGIAEFIVSPSCSLAVYLEEPLSEEDYWLLLEVSRCVARAGEDSAAYSECMGKTAELRSVKLQLI